MGVAYGKAGDLEEILHTLKNFLDGLAEETVNWNDLKVRWRPVTLVWNDVGRLALRDENRTHLNQTPPIPNPVTLEGRIQRCEHETACGAGSHVQSTDEGDITRRRVLHP